MATVDLPHNVPDYRDFTAYTGVVAMDIICREPNHRIRRCNPVCASIRVEISSIERSVTLIEGTL